MVSSATRSVTQSARVDRYGRYSFARVLEAGRSPRASRSGRRPAGCRTPRIPVATAVTAPRARIATPSARRAAELLGSHTNMRPAQTNRLFHARNRRRTLSRWSGEREYVPAHALAAYAAADAGRPSARDRVAHADRLQGRLDPGRGIIGGGTRQPRIQDHRRPELTDDGHRALRCLDPARA